MCAIGGAIDMTSFRRPTAVLLTTGNAGRSWTLHRLPASAGLVREVDCPTTTVCVAVAWTPTATRVRGMTWNDGAGATFPSHIFISKDAGMTWSKARLPKVEGDVYNLGGLACPSAEHCLLEGSRTHVEAIPGKFTTIRGTRVYEVGGATLEAYSLDLRNDTVAPRHRPRGRDLLRLGTPLHHADVVEPQGPLHLHQRRRDLEEACLAHPVEHVHRHASLRVGDIMRRLRRTGAGDDQRRRQTLSESARVRHHHHLVHHVGRLRRSPRLAIPELPRNRRAGRDQPSTLTGASATPPHIVTCRTPLSSPRPPVPGWLRALTAQVKAEMQMRGSAGSPEPSG